MFRATDRTRFWLRLASAGSGGVSVDDSVLVHLRAWTGYSMPVLSRFYGVVVFMNYNDHPPPHFHARYAEREVVVEITTGKVIGTFPPGVRRTILSWTIQHKAELLDSWSKAQTREPLPPIPPLP